MTVSEIINAIAILLSPVIAVAITRWMSNKDALRSDKMKIFSTLMATRYIHGIATSHELVRMYNSIDVIFFKDKKVREKWRELHEHLSDKAKFNNDVYQTKKLKLLESMAEVLGYKNEIRWDQIKDFYLPEGIFKEMQNESEFKDFQMKFSRFFNQILTSNTDTTGKIIPQEAPSNDQNKP